MNDVFSEIKNYGYEEPKKKLIAGIVLTGGGSQLKHIKQLVEYITGMDTRIGYPNEHLATDLKKDLSSPMYATSIGLLMKGLDEKEKEMRIKSLEDKLAESNIVTEETEKQEMFQEVLTKEKRPSFWDKFVTNFKEFIDNAE